MSAFKPYKYKGCIIYSPKNKKFLELFADKISTYTLQEKENLEGNTQFYGGIKYQIALGDRKRIFLISFPSNKSTGTVFLSEE